MTADTRSYSEGYLDALSDLRKEISRRVDREKSSPILKEQAEILHIIARLTEWIGRER